MSVFCVDYGHCLYGADTGASGSTKKEEVLTREVGKLVTVKLRRLGHTVIETNIDSSTSLSNSLGRRVSVINNSDCNISVSIHFNAYNGQAYGCEILNDGITNDISNSILRELSTLGFYNRGIKNGLDLAVVGGVQPRAILIECCFIDNLSDMDKYNAEKVSDAIVKGIDNRHSISSSSNTVNSNKGKVINLFSYRFYLENNKDVREKLIPAGAGEEQKEQIAYDHYINFGKKEGRKPIPDISDFKEKEYLELNKDVADAVKKGVFINGLDHFLQFGYKDKRKVSYNAKEIEEKIIKENEELKKQIENAKNALK